MMNDEPRLNLSTNVRTCGMPIVYVYLNNAMVIHTSLVTQTIIDLAGEQRKKSDLHEQQQQQQKF